MFALIDSHIRAIKTKGKGNTHSLAWRSLRDLHPYNPCQTTRASLQTYSWRWGPRFPDPPYLISGDVICTACSERRRWSPGESIWTIFLQFGPLRRPLWVSRWMRGPFSLPEAGIEHQEPNASDVVTSRPICNLFAYRVDGVVDIVDIAYYMKPYIYIIL